MAQIFISYARQDLEIATSVCDLLKAADFEVKLDLHDIAAGENWRNRLADLIAAADKMVFIVSATSVSSAICAWELEEAQRQGKPIVPLFAAEVALHALPERLQRLNFIWYRTAQERQAGYRKLTEALRLDLGWEREKTRINALADAWQLSGRPKRLLMSRSDMITTAETWRDSRPETSAAPTDTQLAFILESRSAFLRRQRWIQGIAVTVAVATSLLAAAALYQTRVANQQRAQAQTSESRLIARAAQSQIDERGEIGNAIALARAVLPRDLGSPTDRPLTAEPVQVLYNAYHRQRMEIVIRDSEDPTEGALELKGGRLLTWSEAGRTRIWNMETWRPETLDTDALRVDGAVELADGRVLLWSSARSRPEAQIWDGAGRQVAILSTHREEISSAIALSDGRFVTRGARNAILWHDDGTMQARLAEDEDKIREVLPLQDERFLTRSEGGKLRFWGADGAPGPLLWEDPSIGGVVELSTGDLVTWTWGAEAVLWSAAGARKSQLLERAFVSEGLAYPDGRVMLWNGRQYDVFSAAGERQRSLRTGDESASGARVFEDSTAVVWDHYGQGFLWIDSLQTPQPLIGHTGEIEGVLRLRDGRYLSWSIDGSLRVWADSGAALDVLSGHEGRIAHAKELVDGRILTLGADGSLRIWHIGGLPGRMRRAWEDDPPKALQLQDGRVVAWERDGAAALHAIDGAKIRTLSAHRGEVWRATDLGDGRFITVGPQDQRLWFADGQSSIALDGPSFRVYGSLGLRSGAFLVWDRSADAQLRSANGAIIALLRGHCRAQKIVAAQDCAISGALQARDGSVLTWSNDATARLWALDGTARAVLAGHENRISDARQLSDGRFATLSWDNTVRLWDEGGAPLATLKGHGGDITGLLEISNGHLLTWSATNRRQTGHVGNAAIIISWGGDAQPHLWDRDGSLLRRLEGHRAPVQGALALRDGNILTWAGRDGARLWSSDGSPGPVLHADGQSSLGALELNGNRLLIWGETDAQIWEADRTPGPKLIGHPVEIKGSALLEDGRFFTWDRQLRALFWPPDDATLVADADRFLRAGSPLSTSERCYFFLPVPVDC